MRRSLRRQCGLFSIVVVIMIGWFFLGYQEHRNTPVSSGHEDLIRLHVLANSDSSADQQLKLKVRDALIAYLEPYLESVTTKPAAKQIILEHKENLIKVAKQVVFTNEADYPVDLEVGIYDFPIKSYGNLVLPAGKYEAVRILIGKAEGKNWWCVLFPPLCFIDITNATATSLPSEKIANQKDEQEMKIELKSKIAELWREN